MDNICIGTAQFGMDYGVANKKGKPSLNEVFDIFKIALDYKINYFDTAQAYGDSEIVLGKAIKHFQVGNRIKCITKLLPDFKFLNHEQLKNEIVQSIKNLNVDTLYALLLHKPTVQGTWIDFTDSIRLLKIEGLIQNFGVSIYDPDDAIKFVNDEHINILQVPFNIMDRRLIDRDFFSIAAKNKKEIFVRSIYLQGLLLMSNEDIKLKGMEWTSQYIRELSDFVLEKGVNYKDFIIKAIQDKAPKAKFIFGIESKDQLIENINILRLKFKFHKIIDEWWDNLPLFPEKLLNPSLWRMSE